ncbi:MAG: class IV adenylate cyclase [Phycisphaerae bacterium]
MALETEIKVRVESHDPVRTRLRSLGAKFLGRVLESNTIFDRPDGSLRRRGCGLRLRQTEPQPPRTEGEQGEAAPAPPPSPQKVMPTSPHGMRPGRAATLTLKGPLRPGAMKAREELELKVDDGATAMRVLDALGLVPVLAYEKRRESWALDRCRVELDEPPHVGLFVEIEGPDEQTIRAVQRTLGLERREHHQASYVHMLMPYAADHADTNGVLRAP